MTDQRPSEPALAFALYASTAATEAINALRRNGLIDESEVTNLIQVLTTCRTFAGSNPVLIEHAESLIDLLQVPIPKRGGPSSD
jgi:hypothetical protein